MADERYEVPVANLKPDELSAALRQSIADVEGKFPPHTGVCVFVFDFGKGGGMGYISNAERLTMISALREWINHQARLS